MINKINKKCKNKGCNNTVLDGKYCEHCKQIKKEKRNKLMAGAGGAVLVGGGVAAKKGAIKQVPKIAAKVLQIILKK